MSKRAARAPRPMNRPSHKMLLAASLLPALALCWTVLAFAPGGQAFAYYYDCATEYPATQELVAKGDPIYTSSIPNGSYDITASTSSYMCNLYDCVLTVQDGAMWVDFNMTGAYTAIYPGTAEQAAALADASGTDSSSYITGDPPEGYVTHAYSMRIDSLNTIITLATYNGGSSGLAKGRWYTRTLIFNSSDAVDLAVMSKQQDTNGSDDGGDDSSGGSGQDDSDGSSGGDSSSGSNADSSGSQAGSGSTSGSGSGSGSSGSSSNAASSSGSGSGTSTSGGSSSSGSSSNSSGSGSTSSSQGAGQSQTGNSSQSSSAGTSSMSSAVPISLASAGSSGSSDLIAIGQEASQIKNYWPQTLAVLLCCAAALAASAAFMIAKSRKRLDMPLSGDAAGEDGAAEGSRFSGDAGKTGRHSRSKPEAESQSDAVGEGDHSTTR